ncbi:zona pellucida sperm-binding protein 4-like [Xyrichtys novacula]|uniref:Zona pellucida sperm-binding protein 4 n=1 Tax=Xyrichtys novacula TaxID=13765 RepID=A0AAV1F7K2_XYRNO|nr:zona pellucida sperm-binding protein 4-like [Xyrichtys novacula]
MKLVCGCLLAVALLGCLANAQYFMKPQQPQEPQAAQYQPPPPPPQQPQQPQPPKYQPLPQQPQQPQPPKYQPPQQPQQPQPPKYQPPQQPQAPPKYAPQVPQQPKQPQQPTEVFHTCEVAENYKIACGAPGISASDCEAINCCFDGRMCFYGKSVTLQCTKDAQFIVVVARDATLPNIDLESISFYGNDQSCSPVGTTSAFAIYQFPVTACGTVMTEEPGVLVYENRMSSSYEVAIGPAGAITRDSHYELLVQCRYTGTSVEALVIEVGLVPPPPPVAAPGPLRVELRLANGQCTTKGCVEEEVAYNSFYVDSDYPVTKVLRDPVYAEVRMLERTDPNIVLTLGRCWATADPYPHSLPQWDLLIDGCPYRDDRYLTTLVPVDASSGLMYPTHHRRFIFKMFTFVGTGPANPGKGEAAEPEVMTPLKEKVYIHCDAAVCQPSVGNNCEPRCFRQRRDIAASVLKGSRSETTVVSSQELIFIGQ